MKAFLLERDGDLELLAFAIAVLPSGSTPKKYILWAQSTPYRRTLMPKYILLGHMDPLACALLANSRF